MKTKNLILTLFAALALVFATACSDDDDKTDAGVDASTDVTVDDDAEVGDDATADAEEAPKSCMPDVCGASTEDGAECAEGFVCTDEGACVQCQADADCGTQGTGKCNTDTNTCTKCESKADCVVAALLPDLVCNTTTNTCGNCSADTDCTKGENNTGKCSDTDNGGMCNLCTENADCVYDDDGTAMNIGTGKCDTTAGTCTMCEVSADCGDSAVCNADGVCVQCLTNEDCGAAVEGAFNTGKCEKGACLGCDETAECTSATPAETTPAWICK